MIIAIVGLGLIGGSIGLALKKAKAVRKVIGIPRREETIKQALEMNAIDEGSLDIKAAGQADIVFLCTPIHLIIPKLKEVVPHLKKGAIVTDVASSKYEIVKQAQRIVPKSVFFIGGHPMAGKEKVKLEHAQADLFENRVWILTQDGKTSKSALDYLGGIISKTGARILNIDPKIHDHAVAAISHLPLVVAAALVNTVAHAGTGQKEMIECASSGFRDTTRVASGDPELGIDIFLSNQWQVLNEINAFKGQLSVLEKAIKSGNKHQILTLLKRAKDFRDSNVTL